VTADMKNQGHEGTVVILVGHTSSGRTEAVRALEDMGVAGVDNLPPQLLIPFVALRQKSESSRDALSCVVALNLEGGSCIDEAIKAFSALQEGGTHFRIIALEANDSVVTKRIEDSWTHGPLLDITAKLAEERLAIRPLVDRACEVLDTSYLTIPELRDRLALIIKGVAVHRNISIDLYSFGFKYGPFVPSDIVFDVRFIANPYYVEALRDLTGLDAVCAKYVMDQPNSAFFIKSLTVLLTTLGPSYCRSGRTHLTVGIGCTGGQHRSVAIVEELVKELRLHGMRAHAHHRELGHIGEKRISAE